MKHIIKIENEGLTMYVEFMEGGSLFTGDRAQATRFSKKDAAFIAEKLPVASLPGVVSVVRATTGGA